MFISHWHSKKGNNMLSYILTRLRKLENATANIQTGANADGIFLEASQTWLAPNGREYPDYTWAGMRAMGGRPDTSGWTVVTIGGTDSTAMDAAITAAEAAAPAIIYLPNNTYNFTQTHIINESSVIIRGQSVGGTIINFNSGINDKGAIYFRGDTNFDNQSLASDVAKGSKEIPLVAISGNYIADAWIVPQDMAVQDTHNTQYKLGTSGNRDTSIFGRNINQIESVNGTTLTMKKPVRYNYVAGAGMVIRTCQQLENVGVENCTIETTYNPGAYDGIHFKFCVNSWVDNVHIINAGRHPIGFEDSANMEIFDVICDGAWNIGGGGTGYGGAFSCYDVLFKRVHWRDLRHAPHLQDFASGNVFQFCTAEGSNSKIHTKWSRWNLFDATNWFDTTYEESIMEPATRIDNTDTAHQPAGDDNTYFNCDVGRNDGRGSGVYLGGLSKNVQIHYCRVFAPCADEGFPGPITVRNRSMILVWDFHEVDFLNCVFMTDDPQDVAEGISFTPGFVEWTLANDGDNDAWGPSGSGTDPIFTPQPPGTTMSVSLPVIPNNSIVKMENCDFYGFDPARQIVGHASLTTDVNNNWYPTYDPSNKPAQPTPFTPSLYEWQWQERDKLGI